MLAIVLTGGGGPVVGTFSNAPVPGDPLGRLEFGNYAANISYTGEGGMTTGGNDIVVFNLTPVPEPGAVLAVAAWVAVGRLRRRRVSAMA